MAKYQKLSDSWRIGGTEQNTPETLGGLATLGGVGVRSAQGGNPLQVAPKVPKAPKVGSAARGKAGCTPAKAAKITKADHPPTCKVEIVELPQAQRYRKIFGILQLKLPALVPVERWQQCVQDGSRFLAKWGEQAEALGWTSADQFGLHTPPANPHPSYSRLSRYDCTGLIWLLEGREVVALTEATAIIRNPVSGNITTYPRFNKPALGPLGDSLDDLK